MLYTILFTRTIVSITGRRLVELLYNAEGGLHQYDKSAICVDSFQSTDHILAAIFSEVVLKRKSQSAQS